MSPISTIYAPCTPPGKSGVAVLRVSGPAAMESARIISGSLPRPRCMGYRILRHPDTGEAIDEALVVAFPAPHSFTGLDVVEFHIHGGRAVMAALMDVLCGMPGLSMAEPGAFARQAFDHGKLDLTRLEGLADLIDSETAGQRRQALQVMGGHNARLFAGFREGIVAALALLESALDFADEPDVSGDSLAEAAEQARQQAAQVEGWLAGSVFSERLREGFVVAIAGAPNVGKSSLLNAIARREVAIVSDVPGTTRDLIEVQVDLGGIPVRFIDTAGLRESGDPVERIGIARAREALSRADLVLAMEEPGHPFCPGTEMRPVDSLRVVGKADLLADAPESQDREGIFYISSKEYKGIHELMEFIQKRFSAMEKAPDAPVVARARQRRELESCRDHLVCASRQSFPELAAEELRLAAQAIGRLTGMVTPEDVLDGIFSRFCIGK